MLKMLALFLVGRSLLGAVANAETTSALQCGRENPLGEAPSQAGIGRVPVKVTSSGLTITIRYLPYQGRKEREYLYRVLGVENRSLSLVRVDSAGKEKRENTAKMSFDPVLAQKSESARNASLEWTDKAPTKSPMSTLTPGKSWFFCTGIDGFLEDVQERLAKGHP